MDLESLIRTVPDFPKPGIRFRDTDHFAGKVAGIFGALVAHALHVGCAFVIDESE